MNIKVFQNRKVSKDYFDNEGTQNENYSTTLSFEVPLGYEDFSKRIVFITEDGNFWDYIKDNEYVIKNNITKYENIEAYLWLTKDNQDFRSETFELNFYENQNPDDMTPSEEQLDGYNTLIAELELKVEEVDALKEETLEALEKLKEQQIDYENRFKEINKMLKELKDTNEYQSEIIDQFKNEFDEKEFKGANAHLPDSAELPLKLQPQGNIEQDTRQGYNELQVNEDYWEVTEKGIKNKAKNDGTRLDKKGVNLKANVTYYLNFVLLSRPTSATTFTTMLDGASNNNLSFINIEQKSHFTIGKVATKTYTPTKDEELTIKMWGNANSDTFEFQYWVTTKENAPFEIYGAMPSIDFPSEVKGVGGHYDTYISDNFFDNVFRQGSYSFKADTKRVFSQNDFEVKAGQEYTILTNLDISTYYYVIGLATKRFPTETLISDSGWLSLNEYKFIAKDNAYFGLGIRRRDNGNITPSDMENVYFEVVTKHQLLPIDIPFNMYSGKPYKLNGKWYRKVEWNKKVLTGYEDYALETSDIYKRFNLGISDIVNIQARNTNVKSNYFKSTIDNGYSVIMAYENRALFYPTSDITTVEEFKAMLKEKYESGNPVYIVYKLKTPTIEEITDTTLIEQLEDISRAFSYYPVTNVNSYKPTVNVADLILNGKYYVSNKAKFKTLEERVSALENETVNE